MAFARTNNQSRKKKTSCRKSSETFMGGANVVIIVPYLIGPYLLIGLAVWFNYFVPIYSSVHFTVYSVVGSSYCSGGFSVNKIL